MLTSLNVRFYHLVCMETSPLGNLFLRFWHLSNRKIRLLKETLHMKELSELVEAAQSGDSEAYDGLLQRFQPMAYATCAGYVKHLPKKWKV